MQDIKCYPSGIGSQLWTVRLTLPKAGGYTNNKDAEPIMRHCISSLWRSLSGGHYKLVIVDKKSHYLAVVEAILSTSFQIHKEKLKHMFATYGTTRTESDSGPLFNSIDFRYLQHNI